MTPQKPQEGGNMLSSQCLEGTSLEEEKETVCIASPFFTHKPFPLLQFCWWNMGLGIFRLRIS